jgi:hypothetical protein
VRWVARGPTAATSSPGPGAGLAALVAARQAATAAELGEDVLDLVERPKPGEAGVNPAGEALMSRASGPGRIPNEGTDVTSTGDPSMTSWTDEELSSIGNAEELAIASRRPDGSLRPFVTIWVVHTGGDLYVRTVNGRAGTWFRRALAAGEGRIRGRGIARDVAFEEAGSEVHAPVTAAYHEKYDRYGARSVGTVVSAESATTTMRLVPS